MKVVCYTSPSRGHLFPAVPVLLELRRRGHDVVVQTIGAEISALHDLGLRAMPVSPAVEAIEMTDYQARGAQESIKRAVRVFVRRAAVDVPEVQRLIAEERPDLVLVDSNSWGATAVAEASGLPWAILQHFPTPLPSIEVPPFGPGLRPMGGPLGRARNRLLSPLLLGALERTLLPPLNGEVRTLAGVSPVRDAQDLYTRPPLTLYLTSTVFEYPRADWPASFCFVGPLIWDPPSQPPGWLASLRRPVALVTTSSEFQDDGALVATALDGLRAEDLEVVATMPAGVPTGLDLPPNGRIETYVPHSLVLPKAAVTITHGGMGTTQKSLAAGVPVVVIPWGRDQAEVGRRAEATGAAVYLPKRKLSAETLRDSVRRARELRPAAQAVAEGMAAEGGAALAVDRLEALVAG